ncbi:GNAT family N-acetyltransferase [Paracoccus cavernae]|uniref:GNAT family N-acetyltransferase n=1 Tax=Paracoccus cavernae TaxID=1571207 RepID=UPI0035F28996
MRPETIIRSCEIRDYPALKSFDEFMGDRRIDMQQGSLLVAALDDAVIGYVKVAPSEFMGWPLLSILCVAPSSRRQGVGRALVEGAKSCPRWLRLYASTESSNLAMRALLQRCGAHEIGFSDDLNISGERETLFRLK